MALDACSDHAVEKMTLLDRRPGRRPTVPISPISPGLTQDLIPPQQKSEITPVPPRSPSPPSDASDSHVEDTIVCAPVGRNLRPRRQLSHAKRRVTFDEVFQDGNAAVKHFIVQVPSSDGLWYILHCDEHEQAFQHPALRGAAAHLKGSKHGLPWYPTSLEVVKHFGVEVVDCDAELAEKNNSVALAVNQASKKSPESNKEPSECKVDEKSSPKKRQYESNDYNESEVKEKEISKRHPKQRRLSGVTRPIPGRIYLAYWEMTKDWLPALVLPHIGLEAFGIPSTLEELGLTKSTPTCLRCEPDTQNLKWREGYEHDGTHAMDRQFPVLFFDRREFPENASAGWVKASDLQELRVFHTSSRLVPNLKVAKKYLRKRLQREADYEDENSWASSEEGDAEGQVLDKENPSKANFTPARSEPEQPATNVPEIAPVEEEAPSPAKDEPEAVFTAPMLPSPEESRPGTSSKAQAASITMNPVPNSTATNRIRGDIEMISISSSGDEVDDQDQPANSSRPPTANNRMEVDPTESVVTEKQDNRPNTSIAPRPSTYLQPTIAPNMPLTSYTTPDISPIPPPRNQQGHHPVQLPTPIHVHHIQNTLPNHATLDLRNLMKRSTCMGFPGAIPGSEAPQSELPPILKRQPRPRPLEFPNPQGPSTSGFHHHRLPPSRDQQAQSSSPTSPSQLKISLIQSARPLISTETRPLAPRPLQPNATPVPSPPPLPPPAENRAPAPSVPIPQAPKPKQYKAPPSTGNPAPPHPISHPSTPVNWQPVYIGKALQLETTNPRFGVPPNEVPPPFLDRLKKLAGTRDNFPKMSKFLDGNSFYFCPWCEKRYRRAVKFTDHLVLNHSR